MLLAGLHGADMIFWRSEPFFLLRVAFQDFFNVAIGIAMAVLVIEATHIRMEDLNEKLRRLTLITAASTQSLNVDQMLGVVLHHLVESLNASHGLVRLIAGSGDKAELIIRSAIGYSDAYLLEQEKISAKLPWVRKSLEQEQAYTALDGRATAGKIPASAQAEQLSTALLVRLPGPNTASGLDPGRIECETEISPRRNHIRDQRRESVGFDRAKFVVIRAGRDGAAPVGEYVRFHRRSHHRA